MITSIVLLSGGLDSAVLLAKALRESPLDRYVCLVFSYGQRHLWETEQAALLAKHYGCDHHLLELSSAMFGEVGIMKSAPPPRQYEDEVEAVQDDHLSAIVPFRNGIFISVAAALASRLGAQEVLIGTHIQSWRDEHLSAIVPFRNGIFISVAAALASRLGAQEVLIGTHIQSWRDGAFPDCKPEFCGAMGAATWLGVGIKLLAPLQWMTKSDIVKLGASLNVPFRLTRSCFFGETPCGKCLECIARARAFADASVIDPVRREAR